MQRACDYCGTSYEAKTAKSRFCKPEHRVSHHKAIKAGRPLPVQTAKPAPDRPPRTEVRDRLEKELRRLGVFDHYEAATVLYLAEQLDSGLIVGSAFVSLSKELDRRVDVLRLRAVPADDPTKVIQERVKEKQAHLHAV